MIFPAKMRHLTAVVLSEHSDAVTKALLEEGVLHTVDVEQLTDVPPGAIEHYTVDKSDREVSETRGRIESILGIAGITPEAPLDVAKLSPVDLETVNKDLDKLSADMQKIRNKQRDLQNEINRLRDIEHHISTFGDLQRGLARGGEHTYLAVHAGTAPSGARRQIEEDLRSLPSVVVAISDQGDREALAVVTMQRNDEEVSRVLSRHDFQTHALPDGPQELDREAMRDVEAKIAALKAEQSSLNDRLVSMVTERGNHLLDLWANLRMNELYAQLRSHFSHTDHAVVLSGWVPADAATHLQTAIRKITDDRCYIEWNSAKNVEDQARRSVKAPVELRNPGFLKPFQMLVVNYAVPDYGTVDPTPFVAVSYLAMFGLMFQDVGHGAVLVLLGALGLLFTRDGATSESGMRSLFRLGIWCGAASIVTGVMFGSYFGMALLPPLWFDYHGIVAGHGGNGVYSSIFDILELTIYLGITIIGLGLVLNWVNLVAKRQWIDLVFDKGGILGGTMYGAGVAIAFDFAGGGFRSLEIAPLPLLLVAVPALLLFLKAPLEHAESRRSGHGEPLSLATLLWFVMEWIIELLEVFSGYLANTLSFMRVAGLGIAHVTLMMAFFQIAEMASPGPGISLLGIVILVLGNALVIALEGLSAGIQSLRLNYYEFFSKYFSGTGEAYKPVALKPSR